MIDIKEAYEIALKNHPSPKTRKCLCAFQYGDLYIFGLGSKYPLPESTHIVPGIVYYSVHKETGRCEIFNFYDEMYLDTDEFSSAFNNQIPPESFI